MWFALVFGAVVALAGAPAEAAAPDPDPLRWDAPPECPSADEVKAQIEAHLGMPLQDVPLSDWSVDGSITREVDGPWMLRLHVRAPDGPTDRTLHDPRDCAAVSSAAALLVALALDPEAVAASAGAAVSSSEPLESDGPVTPAEEAGREVTPEPSPSSQPSKPPSAERPPAEGVPLDFVLGVAGGLDYGTLRNVSPIGRASFSWELPRVRIGAMASFGGTPGFTVPAVAQDVSLWMWTAGIEAGPVFRVRRFSFPLTAGIEGGQIVIRPRILVPPPGQQVTWAALLVTPAAGWSPRAWLSIVLRAGIAVSFVRPEFSIEGLGRVHAPAPVAFRATLGFEFRIPLAVMKSGAGGNPRERR